MSAPAARFIPATSSIETSRESDPDMHLNSIRTMVFCHSGIGAYGLGGYSSHNDLHRYRRATSNIARRAEENYPWRGAYDVRGRATCNR